MRRPVAAQRLIPVAGATLALLTVMLHASVAPGWWLLLPLAALAVRGWRGEAAVVLVIAVLAVLRFEARVGQQWPAADYNAERQLRGHVSSVQPPDADAVRFDFTVADGRRLRLSWYDTQARPLGGECWELDARLRPPRGYLNPGGFDYEAWLFRSGVTAIGYVRHGRRCAPDRSGLVAWRDRWRRALDARLDGARGGAYVAGLVLGLRDGLSQADWDALRASGATHLFAISGLHLGLVVAAVGAALSLLTRRFGPGGSRSLIVGTGAVLAATAYASLAGWQIATLRAWLMVVIATLAALRGWWRQPVAVLALALLLVLLLDPFAPLAPGFWLSFGAVAWLLWLGLTLRLRGWRAAVAMQLWLSLALLPLTVLWFDQVALLAPLANLVLIPLFALLVPALLLAAPLALAGWAEPLQWLAAVLDTVMAVLQALALTWPALNWGAAGLQAAVLLALAGVALLALPAAFGLRVIGLVCLLPLLLSRPPVPGPGHARLWVLDVGQGSAVLVRTAGHALLFDAGPAYPSGFDTGAAVVVPTLRHLGVTQLDMLIVSHGDRDHIGGAAAVADALPLRQRLGVGGRPCRAGQAWSWDGVRFEVLHPDGGDWSDNNGSCVLRVATAHSRALLTGDIEAGAERALLARADLAADVVVVPHHGSRSSSTPEFVAAAAPDWAVVSAGFHNRWRFPAAEVERRWRAAGAAVLVTGWSGAVRVDLGSEPVIEAARERQRTFWRPPDPLLDSRYAGARLSSAP